MKLFEFRIDRKISMIENMLKQEEPRFAHLPGGRAEYVRNLISEEEETGKSNNPHNKPTRVTLFKEDLPQGDIGGRGAALLAERYVSVAAASASEHCPLLKAHVTTSVTVPTTSTTTTTTKGVFWGAYVGLVGLGWPVQIVPF